MYSVTNRSSFDEVSHFYEQILRVRDEDTYPMVLVGYVLYFEKKLM